jgi:hypothetical protein
MVRYVPREFCVATFLTDEPCYLPTSVAGLRATREVDVKKTFDGKLGSGFFITSLTPETSTLSASSLVIDLSSEMLRILVTSIQELPKPALRNYPSYPNWPNFSSYSNYSN